MKTRFHYSVQNCGDGSAYPKFLSSAELAQWDQDHMSEGWGESCCGYLEVKSDELVLCDEVQSALEYYLDKFEYGEEDEDKADFLEEFFPNGLPTFHVECDPENRYYLIKDGAYVVGKRYAYPEEKPTEEKRAVLQAELNGQPPPLTDDQRSDLEKTLSGKVTKRP